MCFDVSELKTQQTYEMGRKENVCEVGDGLQVVLSGIQWRAAVNVEMNVAQTARNLLTN
jgi:hypothetical protein